MQGMKRPELRNELYMQLIKQSRGNVTSTAFRVWELFFLVAATMPPSKDYVGLVSEYVHVFSHTDQEAEQRVKQLALKTWHALKRSAKAGARRTASLLSLQKAQFSYRIPVWVGNLLEWETRVGEPNFEIVHTQI